MVLPSSTPSSFAGIGFVVSVWRSFCSFFFFFGISESDETDFSSSESSSLESEVLGPSASWLSSDLITFGKWRGTESFFPFWPISDLTIFGNDSGFVLLPSRSFSKRKIYIRIGNSSKIKMLPSRTAVMYWSFGTAQSTATWRPEKSGIISENNWKNAKPYFEFLFRSFAPSLPSHFPLSEIERMRNRRWMLDLKKNQVLLRQ